MNSKFKLCANFHLGVLQRLSFPTGTWETFGFDESGQQALNLLKKDSLNEFRNVHSDVIILVEGRGYPLMKEANEKSKEVSISEAVDEDELNKLKMAWRIPFK